MNQASQVFAVRWQAIRPWLTTIAVIWLLMFVGLGWLVKSFLFLIGFVTIAPLAGFLGLQWWLKRNLIEGTCPVCQQGLSALKQPQMSCPNCGTRLKIENQSFERMASPGTIDVQAVEVVSQTVEGD